MNDALASNPVRDYLAEIGRRGGESTRRNTTEAQRTRYAKKAARARWRKRKRRKS